MTVSRQPRADASVRHVWDDATCAAVLSRIGEPIVIRDEAGRCRFVNDAACTLHGRSRSELLGHDIAEFRTPEDSDAHQQARRRVRETGSSSRIATLVRGDGRVLRIQASVTALGDGTYLGIGRDVTDELEEVAAARAEAERWRARTEAAADPLLVTSPDGRVAYANPAAALLLGLEAAHVLGRSLREFVALGEGEEPQAIEAPDAPLVQEWAAVVTRADGAALPAEAHIVRLGGAERLIRLRLIASQTAADQRTPRRVEIAGLTIDFPLQLIIRDGAAISLTPTESRVLAELVSSRGNVLTPHELIERVWGVTDTKNVGLVRHIISRLRKKVEPDRHRPTYIVTVPGSGYVFAPDPLPVSAS